MPHPEKISLSASDRLSEYAELEKAALCLIFTPLRPLDFKRSPIGLRLRLVQMLDSMGLRGACIVISTSPSQWLFCRWIGELRSPKLRAHNIASSIANDLGASCSSSRLCIHCLWTGLSTASRRRNSKRNAGQMKAFRACRSCRSIFGCAAEILDRTLQLRTVPGAKYSIANDSMEHCM